MIDFPNAWFVQHVWRPISCRMTISMLRRRFPSDTCLPSRHRVRSRAALFLFGLGTLVFGASATLHAESITIATAANFLNPLRALQAEYEASTGYDIAVVSGSTGQLYAQIINGAPFDILLAADRERPRLLADAGWGDASSRFTYAIGRLALWSREPALVDGLSLDELGALEFRWLAIASPAVAPYGVAAEQVLEALGIWQEMQSRMVRGQNIAQTFALVETRNAELGLVALSQALTYENTAAYVIVPRELHDPIGQDAILLGPARENSAALDFLKFLQSPTATAIIERHGYYTAE